MRSKSHLYKFIKTNLAYLLIAFIGAGLIILSYLEHFTPDSALYLRETVLMSELIKRGEWFGNYGVGVHGFLFKLPVALIYIVTGPSILVAGLYTSVLSILSLLLFYRILITYFHLKNWSLVPIAFLAINYRFIISSITYLREVPVLLSLLLFLEAILGNKSKWLISLYLLLILEAKEYVFFVLLPTYILYLMIINYKLVKTSIFKYLKNVGITTFSSFILPVIWILLMFYTSIIPINMFIPAMTYQVNGWNELSDTVSEDFNNDSLEGNFNSSVMINFIDKNAVKPIIITNPVINIFEKIISYIHNILKPIQDFIYNFIILNILKVFYPNEFSFEAVPMIVFIPAIIMSFLMFKKQIKSNNKLIIIALIFWLYFVIYTIKSSRARYLFPIAPIIFLYFTFYLKEQLGRESTKKILLNTFIFLLVSFIFAESYLSMLIGLISITTLFIFFYLKRKLFSVKKKITVRQIMMLTLPMISIAIIFLIFMVSKYSNELINQNRYGINYEAAKVLSYFPTSQNIWINNFLINKSDKDVIYFYRKDLSLEPEWNWSLKDNISKKMMLKKINTTNTYLFDLKNEIDLKSKIDKYKIKKVVLVTSVDTDFDFPNEDKYKLLKKINWLRLEDKITLQNKIMYIYTIKK